MQKNCFLTLNSNTDFKNLSEVFPDIKYSNMDDENLKLQLLLPWYDRLNPPKEKFPLIIFIQGSAWTTPNIYYEIPQLSEFSKMGYAVATIVHRDCTKNNPFPAFLKDVKTAIRFLRKESDVYNIDGDRVGIFGTSSGGNAALLTALTIGDERYFSKEYSEYSDNVDYCIACFPPTDLLDLYTDESIDAGIRDLINLLSGNTASTDPSILKEISPFHIINAEKKYPNILIAHGDKDELIPYSQGFKLYEKLKEFNHDVSFIKVNDAPHEGSFWSSEILDLFKEFIKDNS